MEANYVHKDSTTLVQDEVVKNELNQIELRYNTLKQQKFNELLKENQALKKQLENCYCNRTDCSGRIKDSKVYDSLVQKVETQQKEFIKYLEDEKDRLARECSNIYENSDINKDKLEEYLKNNDVSLTFEVIDIKNDPHIIEYDKSKIILLDIIHNDYDFKKEPYEKVQELSKLINCECKTIYKEFDNVREFHKWYIENTDEDDLSKEDIEGVVIECNGIMTKLKFPYYNFWKLMRRVKEQLLHNSNIKLSRLYNSTSNYFYAWLKEQNEETLKKDIITLRKKYYECYRIGKINK